MCQVIKQLISNFNLLENLRENTDYNLPNISTRITPVHYIYTTLSQIVFFTQPKPGKSRSKKLHALLDT